MTLTCLAHRILEKLTTSLHLYCSWTSSLGLSANVPQTAGFVIQPFQTVAETFLFVQWDQSSVNPSLNCTSEIISTYYLNKKHGPEFYMRCHCTSQLHFTFTADIIAEAPIGPSATCDGKFLTETGRTERSWLCTVSSLLSNIILPSRPTLCLPPTYSPSFLPNVSVFKLKRTCLVVHHIGVFRSK